MNPRELFREATNGSIANALGATATLPVTWIGVRTRSSAAEVL
jgi:hypothetical protein